MPARRSTQVTRTEFRTFAKSVGTRFDRTDDTMRILADNQRIFADQLREQGVVLERVDSNVTALAEALTSTRDELKRDIAGLSSRIDALEAAVRQNSADIHKNTTDIRRLAHEVAELRGRFDRREGTLDAIDARVRELEKLAGIRR